MFNQTSLATESMALGATRHSDTGSSAMGCNGLTASDQDLRRTKNELFSKLMERQPHPAAISPANKTISEENIPNSMRSIAANHARNQLNGQKASAGDLRSSAGFNNHVINTANDLEGPALFSRLRSRWYTNDEVASILTNFSSHPEWQTNELQIRPQSGAVLLYSRERVRYRQDGYCWKKRKNGRTTREDHMKLKVQGIECIYGCYVHSALLPTFHRRCYWLLENPDIVLVHYLNQPPDDKGKMVVTFNASVLEADTRRRWTNEEIIEEIGSVFGGISHIHQTLSINFPAVDKQQQQNQSVPHAQPSNGLTGPTDMSLMQQRGEEGHHQQQQLDPPDNNCDTRSLITLPEDGSPPPSQSLGQHQSMNYSIDDGKKPNMFDMINKSVVLHNNMPTRDGCSQGVDDEMIVMNQDTEVMDTQQPPKTVSFTRGTNEQESPFETEHGASHSASLTNVNLPGTSDGDAGNPMGQDPCSPVTQIYNKIVDDIETYVLPLEMNHFDPSGHHHVASSGGVQMMDTNEQDSEQQGIATKDSHQFASGVHQDTTMIKREQSNMSPVELLSCDLFENCSNFGNEDLTRCRARGRSEENQRCRAPSNLLLTDFSLRSTDRSSSRAIDDELGSNSLANPDEMRDLMIGIASGSADNHGEDSRNADQLLIGCETTDTLELFDLKQLSSNCEHEYRHQLDVKSTTSDTDTLNRLSPIVTLVPRCNSTDNAVMQTSIQRTNNQYQSQHHASNQFLSNTAFTAHTAASQNNDNLMQNFTEFDTHQEDTNVGLIHRCTPATTSSTEPSNSTSCSASSLVNAGAGSTSQSGASFINSGVPSIYQETSSANSFIKLPLPHRQNSEQREPSNSVLSSLLPKALSLDGSDLSSTGYRNHPHHYHHHPHHHQNPHPNRTSPLTGSYHRGGGISAGPRQHANASGYGNSSAINQASNNILMIPPNSNPQQPQTGSLNPGNNSRRYCQRPSAPSLSPSSGNYSLDSSTSCGSRVFAGSNQNRSGSAISSTGSIGHLLVGQQQTTELPNRSRLRTPLATYAHLLPILDYVPNWSHSSGGTKVLLIGNWTCLLGSELHGVTSLAKSEDTPMPEQTATEGFTILFDDLVVAATLIQDNVLRCYSPQRDPGFIALKVVYKNLIVSEQVLFEIRASNLVASTTTSTTASNLGTATTSAAAAATATAMTTSALASVSQEERAFGLTQVN